MKKFPYHIIQKAYKFLLDKAMKKYPLNI